MKIIESLKMWVVGASVAILAACGGGGGSSAPPTSNDTIVATPSSTSDINVLLGSSTDFSVTFTTSDGKTATNLSITSGLSALPAGWTGPTSFTCATVSTGNGCMANFTYHPTTVGSGSVTFNYSYTNNAGTNMTGTASVNYKSTSANNIVGAASPAGQVAVIAGSSATVGVTFTTDDGNPATALSVDTSALPSYWSAPASNFKCATVSTGNGCAVNLTYAPVANRDDNGAVHLTFTYVDNSGTSKSGSVTIPYIATTRDNVVATPSPAGQIALIAGASATVGVTFTTDDGNPATVLSADTSSLPTGWSAPGSSFTCATVATGNGCKVNLTFAPPAHVDSKGTLSVNYTYKDNSGATKTGSFSIPYVATTQNNVVATPSPAGQIAVIAGSSTNVGVTFTTDDGNPATVLSADTSSLPAGWTGPTSFTCATVTSGSGCLINLTFAPAAHVDSSGTVLVNFTYKDNSGAAKTGSFSIPYVATTQNNVVTAQSPAGQISLAPGGTQVVKIDFTTDDTNPATALTVTAADLTSLPTGWTGPATFSCGTVSTGNGCELSLTYHPLLSASGTVTLHFGYTNNSGTAQTGTVNINYAAASDNTVAGTVSPSGTINGIVGGNAQTVTVTFNSSDPNPASSLSVTSGLGSLPSGWTGPANFTCATIANTGSGCQLSLTFNPSAAGSGTVQLNYGYHANSGTAKTGSVNIAYASTTHDTLVSAQSPSGTVGAVVNGGSQPVTLTFTSSDSNPVTSVTVTSGLSSLPAGWSGPGSFSCASASTGTGCRLTLTYAPTVNGSGTVALGLSYSDDSGTAKTANVSVNYASIPGQLYLTDTTSSVLRCGISGTDGSLSGCSTAVGSLSTVSGIAFSGNFAYIAPGAAATDVDVCAVAADGSLSGCTLAQAFGSPNSLAVSGNQLYVGDASGPNINNCTINADGTLSNCIASYIGTVNTVDGIAVTATNAYIVDLNGDQLTTCSVATSGPQIGSLFNCGQQSLNDTAPLGGNTPHAAPHSAYVSGGNLYIGTTAGVMMLPIAGNGTVTPSYPCTVWTGSGSATGATCTIDGAGPVQTPITGMVFNNGFAYFAGVGGGGGLGICKVESNGLMDNCVTSPNASLTGAYGGLAVH